MPRRKPDLYPIDPETKRLARYLFRMIDKRDWGYLDRDSGRPKFAHTAAELYASPGVRQPMTRQLIQAHREGRDRLYGTSRRNSGYCLAMIDVDQHDRQTDGFDLVRHLAVRYFPGCYFEPSRRGFHLYVAFWCKFVPRSEMNWLLVSLRDSLRTIAVAEGFESTLDVTGSFGEPRHVNHGSGEESYQHGTLFVLPNPGTPEAMGRLVFAPIYLPRVIRSIDAEARHYIESEGSPGSHQTQIPPYTSIPSKTVGRPYTDGWHSMHQLCGEMTRQRGRVPDGQTLLAAYCDAYGRSDDKPERRDRAERIATYHDQNHDFDRLAGFAYHRSRLHSLIADWVDDWDAITAAARVKKVRKLSPDDLAVVLYLAERVSFTACENPLEQFGMPYESIRGMFKTLASDGTIDQVRTEGKELKLILDVLLGAGLIAAMHRKCRFGGRRKGVGYKWTVGPSHPRYLGHLAFRETVCIDYVGTPNAGVKVAARSTTPG